MKDDELAKFFAQGILVDASVQSMDIPDIDKLISKMNDRGATFLDAKLLYDISENNIENDAFSVEVVKTYGGERSPAKPADWVACFNDRFNRLKNILLSKPECNSVMSISNIKTAPNNSTVSTIAMISNVSISPIKKFMILEIEDNTGSFKAISSQNNLEIVKDQVVFISGKKSNDAMFINQVIFPDIFVKSQKNDNVPDAYAVFISDVHIGSKLFAEDALKRFISWLKGEIPEFSSIAKAVKFIFLCGDLVDGIGVYPDQEKELSITDIREQYDSLYKMLDQIPKGIKLIISPGNHDATHIAEPQPCISSNFAGRIYNLRNAVFVSNPAYVNIRFSTEKIGVLVYHGFSIPYYADTINKYSKMDTDDIAAIMKIHLRSRHLSPTHGASQILPLQRDYLVIDETPDIYATGHIHKTLLSKYKETILVNSSCWQFQTDYQKKYGQKPDVAKVPMVNLKDKSMIVLDFLNEKIQTYEKGIKAHAS